jgi:hypothetical protein
MDYMKYIVSIAVLLVIGLVYEKYKIGLINDEDKRNYEMVKKYLVNDSSLAKSKLPIIWIHLKYEYNSRWWPSFYSRNTYELNQPYLFLTIKSIIDKCGSSFNICLIDDSSFENIVPGWTINMQKVAEPIKSKLRELAMTRLLKHYGGLIVPPSFVCTKNLADMYYSMTCQGKPVIGELLDRNSTSEYVDYYPSSKFMGCSKNCKLIDEYISYLENMISEDYTAESVFLGSQDRWLYAEVRNGNVNLLPASVLGVEDTDGKPIVIERLMGNSYIDFVPTALGVMLPSCEILKRTKFEWFARLSVRQALECDNIAGKLLLTCR